MKLTRYSSPAEVIMHHPKREEWDAKWDDPWYKPINTSCTGMEPAQDNVVMRRHLREFYPDFCQIVKVTELNREQLMSAINRLATESMEIM